MKRILFCILLLASLTACMGVSAPGANRCTEKKELCIKLTAKEPIIYGEPITVTVKVTSDIDITNLQIFLFSGSALEVLFEEPSLRTWKEHDINWKVNAKAKETLTFESKVLLPTEEGSYQIIAQASTSNMIVSSSFRIYLKNKNAKVNYPGTKFPVTEEPLPMYTVTPGPSPTPFPTPTLWGAATSYP